MQDTWRIASCPTTQPPTTVARRRALGTALQALPAIVARGRWQQIRIPFTIREAGRPP